MLRRRVVEGSLTAYDDDGLCAVGFSGWVAHQFEDSDGVFMAIGERTASGGGAGAVRTEGESGEGEAEH